MSQDMTRQGLGDAGAERDRLHLVPTTPGTVEKHVAAIFGKLGLPPAEDHNLRVPAVIRHLQP